MSYSMMLRIKGGKTLIGKEASPLRTSKLSSTATHSPSLAAVFPPLYSPIMATPSSYRGGVWWGFGRRSARCRALCVCYSFSLALGGRISRLVLPVGRGRVRITHWYALGLIRCKLRWCRCSLIVRRPRLCRFLSAKQPRKKAPKKEAGSFASAEATKAARLGTREPLKRLHRNFNTVRPTLPCLSPSSKGKALGGVQGQSPCVVLSRLIQ